MGRDAGISFGDRSRQPHPLDCQCGVCGFKRKAVAEQVRVSRRAALERDIKDRLDVQWFCGLIVSSVLIIVVFNFAEKAGMVMGESIFYWVILASFPPSMFGLDFYLHSASHYERTRRNIVRHDLKILKADTASKAKDFMEKRRQ